MDNRENDHLKIEESSIKDEDILNEMLWDSGVLVLTNTFEDTIIR